MRASLCYWLIAACLLGWTGCEPARPALTRVFDRANALNAAEQAALQARLDSLALPGLDFRAYIEPSLQGRDLSEVAFELAKRYPLGEPGVNNGALILVAVQDRKVKILCETGLEWHISDEQAGEIIEQMRPSLATGAYAKGLQTGFDRMASLASGVSWGVDYRTVEEIYAAQERALGKIAAIPGEVAAQTIPAEWLESQFHPNLVARIVTPQADTLQLRFTKYMAEAVENRFGGPATWFFRLESVAPLRGLLLGVQ